jgi:SAM-dependent methyltransferase
VDETLAAVAAAYDDLEAPGSFPDRAALEAYREGLLKVSRPQAELLAGLLSAEARVLEIGCGNGRLLVELAQRRALAAGRGVDVSRSRIAFAQAWTSELGLDGLTFEAADALEVELEPDSHDAAICITGALGYFGAADPRLDGELLARLSRGLTPGGLLCVEVYPHRHERRLLDAAGGHIRLWRELSAEDPWRFYLSELSLREGVLTHAKTFIHRETGEIDSGRSELLHLYDEAELRELLEAAGFRSVECREGWTAEPYAGGEVLVALARSS